MGRAVCLVEKGTIGGTCVNIGCVPSKALIRAADRMQGWPPALQDHDQGGGLDWARSSATKTRWLKIFGKPSAWTCWSRRDRIHVMRGQARIQPDGVVVVDTRRAVHGKKIVVATGARPAMLPVDGIDRVAVLTSTTAMSLSEQPRSLVVVGGASSRSSWGRCSPVSARR